MACCSTFLQVFQKKASNRDNQRSEEYDAIDVEQFYNKRPKRTGIYFLCHESYLAEIQSIAQDYIIGEPISIWDEFFEVHPVRDPICQEFVSICFKPDFVNDYPDLIRMASYRWLNVQGVGSSGGSYRAPSNYMWFLKWLKDNKHLGWMDFMANIVVNVETDETVAYMGLFFAMLETISEWMLQPDQLSQSLERAWIYQESAFGPFDSNGIHLVFDDIRSLGLKLQQADNGDKLNICKLFCSKAEHMAKLMDRRGYFAYAAEKSLLKDRQYAYYGSEPHFDKTLNVLEILLSRTFTDDERENLSDEFVQDIHRIISSGYSKGYTAMYHLVDFFTAAKDDEGYQIAFEAMMALCTCKSWTHSSSKEDFFEQVGDPLLAAYSALNVSYESDREASVTKVAIAIIGKDYDATMDYETFCRNIWIGAANLCLKTSQQSDSGLGLVRTSKISFQPTIPRGKRFLGGMSVSGAKFCGNGKYKSSSGDIAQFDWIPILVTNYTFSFDYDFDKSLWKRQEDDGETQYFDIYFCRGPADTAYFCGVVCVRKNDEEDNQEEKKEDENDIVPTYAWFYTSRDVPTFSEPMQEGVFA